MSSKQEQTLITLYRGMSSAEIRSRLAGTGLIPLARGVAENELHQRLARAAAGTGTVEEASTGNARDAAPRQTHGRPSDAVVVLRIFLMAVIVLTILVASALLVPSLAPLIWAGTVFGLAMLTGKAFPLFAKIVGALLMAAPLAIFGLLIYQHRTSHWGTGEVMLNYLAAMVYCVIVAAVGRVLYGPANDQG